VETFADATPLRRRRLASTPQPTQCVKEPFEWHSSVVRKISASLALAEMERCGQSEIVVRPAREYEATVVVAVRRRKTPGTALSTASRTHARCSFADRSETSVDLGDDCRSKSEPIELARSKAPLNHLLLDFGDRLSRVQSFGTGLRAIHDGVAAIKPIRVLEIIQSFPSCLITRINNPALRLQQCGRAEIALGVPPIARTRRRTACA
jgi:hypothetical protein